MDKQTIIEVVNERLTKPELRTLLHMGYKEELVLTVGLKIVFRGLRNICMFEAAIFEEGQPKQLMLINPLEFNLWRDE